MSIQTHRTPGKLPETWDRSVVFFANILSLFYGNEMEINALRQEVGSLRTYGSRLVPVIDILFRGNANILILEKPPNPSLLDYFTDVLNLSLPEIKVFTRHDYIALGSQQEEDLHKIEDRILEIQKTEAEWIDGYVTEPHLIKIAERTHKTTISSLNGSYHGNNKLLLHQHLEKCGLPVFDTCIAERQQDVQKGLKELKALGYRLAVVKAPIGASGIGMIKINIADDGSEIPPYLFHEGPCLVQGWLDQSIEGVDRVFSPSVQMFIKEDDLTLHDITEQILSKESVHEGNVAPPAFSEYEAVAGEIFDQAEVAGSWLHDQEYRGTASADFHLIKRAGKYEVRICELNARVTGCTYPSMLAQKFFPGGIWLMRNILFSPPQSGEHFLNQLKKNKTLFKPRGKSGILPINLNPNQQGDIAKGQFLYLGETHQEVFGLLKRMGEDNDFKGVYDRD